MDSLRVDGLAVMYGAGGHPRRRLSRERGCGQVVTIMEIRIDS